MTSWRPGQCAGLPDASCEPDGRVVSADCQQLGVLAVPAVLLPEVRKQGEAWRHCKTCTYVFFNARFFSRTLNCKFTLNRENIWLKKYKYFCLQKSDLSRIRFCTLTICGKCVTDLTLPVPAGRGFSFKLTMFSSHNVLIVSNKPKIISNQIL